MKSSNARFGLALLASPLLGATAAAAEPPLAPDFGGRTLLDLSAHPEAWPASLVTPVAVTVDPKLAAPRACTLGGLAHGQLGWLAEAAPEAEHAALAAGGVPIRRDGGVLTVTPASGPPIVLTDWTDPGSSSAEGDSRRYAYVGRVAGLLRIEVQYGHDAPGSYLVDPLDGDVAYLHNGGRVAALDGATVATFDELNEPHRLVIARLGGDTAIALECRFDTRIPATGCGYLVPGLFALQWNAATPVAMTVRHDDHGWRLIANGDAAALAATCRSVAR